MKILGIELKSSEARLVVLETNGNGFECLDISPKKLALTDESTKSIRSFVQVFNGFIANNSIDLIAIKQRNTKGKFAGGPTSFRIEGVIQAVTDIEVLIVSPTTIAASLKKTQLDRPEFLLVYQGSAFEVAACIASKSC